MKTWDQVIKEGMYKFLHADEYAYFYGAKGQRLTWDVMEALWQAEYNTYFKKRYSEKDKLEIFSFSYGKIGYDCSGFISAITGCHADSYSLFERCTNKSTDLSKGVAGSLLWMPSHIGIDIGMGYYLHTGVERTSISLGKLSEGKVKWQKCGQLTSYIDYKGATNL